MMTTKRIGVAKLRVETTGIMAMSGVVVPRCIVSRGGSDALIVDVDGQGKS